MRIASVVILLFFFRLSGAQFFLGLSPEEIMDSMRIAYPDFSQVKNTNRSYSYLKYVDWSNEQTWMFMIVENQCRMMRMIVDNSMYRDKKIEFNKIGYRLNKYTWIQDQYIVKINKRKHFTTVSVRKKFPSYRPHQQFFYKFKFVWYIT